MTTTTSMEWIFSTPVNDDWRSSIAAVGAQQDDEAVRLLLESWRSDDDEDSQDMLDESGDSVIGNNGGEDLLDTAHDHHIPFATTSPLEEELLYETASLLLPCDDGDYILLQMDHGPMSLMPPHLISEGEEEDESDSLTEGSISETMQDRYQRALGKLAESVQRSVQSRSKILAAKGGEVHQIFSTMQKSTEQLQVHLQKMQTMQTSIADLEQRRAS